MLKHLQSSEEFNEKSLGAKGFTLIELLVVIIILGVLAAVAIFAVGNINENARKKACNTEVSTVQSAIDAYRAQYQDETGYAEPDLLDLQATSGSFQGNLKKTTPKYVVVATVGGKTVINRTNTGANGVALPDCKTETGV